MRAVFLILAMLLAGFALGGCASETNDQADDLNTFTPTPEKPEDSHGWGYNVQSGGH